MARRRGWGGAPPSNDNQANDRIVQTASALMEQTRSAITLADVAQALGVTRQTIYRYFPTAESLMTAAAEASVDAFLAQLAEKTRGITDAADAIVEAMLVTLRLVPDNPQIGLMFSTAYAPANVPLVLSEHAIDLGMQAIEKLDVDWEANGYTSESMRELVEFTLRVMQSFLAAPSPKRTDNQLREFVHRWVGTSVAWDAHLRKNSVAALSDA